MAIKTNAQKLRYMDPYIYDLKPWHFGVSFSANYGKFRLNTAKDFIFQDSILFIESNGRPGLGLTAIADLRLGDHFNLRTLPGLNFHNRSLTYHFKDRKDIVDVESITMDLPINLKFKSKLHKKFVRFYTVAGVRAGYDFSSRENEERAPFKKLVAMKEISASYEIGFGFDFYLPFFKFSPEIKMINSMVNMHSADQYIYSRGIGAIYPRIFQISMHFE